jgi:hypothetical protein
MSIRLSKEYGVNPSVTCCKCCGKEIGIALFGTSYKDENGNTAKAPHKVAMGLCDDCKSCLDQGGVIIIEVKDGESGKNPYRTGRMVGITKEAANRIFNNVTSNINYMEESLFSKIFNNIMPEKGKEYATNT